jgi:hypothetical protein
MNGAVQFSSTAFRRSLLGPCSRWSQFVIRHDRLIRPRRRCGTCSASHRPGAGRTTPNGLVRIALQRAADGTIAVGWIR